MTVAEQDRVVEQIVQEIVTLSQPLRVVLFGSATRPAGAPARDLDFLVIISDHQDPGSILDRLNLEVKTRTIPCDFLVVTEETIKRHGQTAGLIYREALQEGLVLYAA